MEVGSTLKSKSIDLDSKSIFWIGSWANSDEKKERTLNNIRLLKRAGVDVGIITHYPDISWIDADFVDYVVFEKYNHIPDSYNNLFSGGFSSMMGSCWKKVFEFGDFNFEKGLATGLHTFPILRSISHACEISKNLSYSAFCYAEEDFIFNDSFSEFLESEFNHIKSGLCDFSGFDSYTTEGGINPCVFLANPIFLSKHLNQEMLKDEIHFFLNFPNKITEDVLMDISKKSKKLRVFESSKITEILGEYGKGWDISHVGFSWAKEADKNSLSTICTNYPFLRKKDDSTYSLSYLMRQELIPEPLDFHAKIILQEDDGSESLIFESEATLDHDWWKAWLDVYEFTSKKNSKFIIETKIKSSSDQVHTNFVLKLTEEELNGYHRIFSLKKLR